MSKKIIRKYFTQKDQPNSIPYVTSYYKKGGGFVYLKKKKKLPSGNYRVFINSSLKNGNLKLSHAILKGKSKRNIF